jgi:serine/threonine protein kinase
MHATCAGAVLAGRYRLGRLIGRGPVGEVYEGVRLGEGSRVILKTFKPSTSAAFPRFEEVARAAANVEGLQAIRVLEIQAEAYGDPAFVVLEPTVGVSLDRLLRDAGKLPEGRAAAIAASLLTSLSAAHRAGIVHKDLKPTNVFLAAAASVRVSDFGTGELLERLRPSRLLPPDLDRPAYLAPEQVRSGEIDARSDLYAVGAILYHALCGRPPFDSTNSAVLLYSVLSVPPPPIAKIRPDISDGLAAVVLRALAKDPAARFADAGEMRDALAPWLAAPAATAPAPSEPARPPASPRRAVPPPPRRPVVPPPAAAAQISPVPPLPPPSRIDPPPPSRVSGKERSPAPGSLPPAPGIPARTARGHRRNDRRRLLAAAVLLAIGVGVALALPRRGAKPEGERPEPVAASEPATMPVRSHPASEAMPLASSPVAPTKAEDLAEEVEPPASRPSRRRARRRPPLTRQAMLSVMITNGLYPPSVVHEHLRGRSAQINACFGLTRRPRAGWRIGIDAEGEVQTVKPVGRARRAKRLNRCMRRLFGGIAWGRPSRDDGGSIELHFTARPVVLARR